MVNLNFELTNKTILWIHIIQERLLRQEAKELLENGQNGQHEDTNEQLCEEYYLEHDTDNYGYTEEYYDEESE